MIINHTMHGHHPNPSNHQVGLLCALARQKLFSIIMRSNKMLNPINVRFVELRHAKWNGACTAFNGASRPTRGIIKVLLIVYNTNNILWRLVGRRWCVAILLNKINKNANRNHI